jgi:hypothetical protein
MKLKLRRGDASDVFWSFWDSVPTWFGLGPPGKPVIDMGWLECESDPNWRKGGFCAKAGPYFPKDPLPMPNAMGPEYGPAKPKPSTGDYKPIDWNPPDLDPINMDLLNPTSPGEVLPPVEYPLPSGEVYTAPAGTPSTWTDIERMNFYNTVCVTDALALVKDGPPPQAALLDQAGIDTCDGVEGELFDASDEIEEAIEIQRALEVLESAGHAEPANDAAEGPGLEDNINDWPNNPGMGPGNMIPGNGIPGADPENLEAVSPINKWIGRPEVDNTEGISTPNGPTLNDISNIMMLGGVVAESVSSYDTFASIENGPRWKRGFRRTVRKIRQWSRRRNYNGFFDPEATKHMNHAFGLENDPILRGPGPEDDPTYVRPTEQEN